MKASEIRFPKGQKSIIGRKSSITAAFWKAVIPYLAPSEDEIAEALHILCIDPDDCRCAYCGDPATEWDHFHAVTRFRKPTGYIGEIANFVPACGKCNQSRGNKDWREWIVSNAQHSPTRRRVPDLDERIRRLEAFEQWRTARRIDFEACADPTLWAEYARQLDEIVQHLTDAQHVADQIVTQIELELRLQGK